MIFLFSFLSCCIHILRPFLIITVQWHALFLHSLLRSLQFMLRINLITLSSAKKFISRKKKKKRKEKIIVLCHILFYFIFFSLFLFIPYETSSMLICWLSIYMSDTTYIYMYTYADIADTLALTKFYIFLILQSQP